MGTVDTERTCLASLIDGFCFSPQVESILHAITQTVCALCLKSPMTNASMTGLSLSPDKADLLLVFFPLKDDFASRISFF